LKRAPNQKNASERESFWKNFPVALQHQVLDSAQRNEMYLDLLPEDVLDQVVIPLAGSIECPTCRRPLQLDDKKSSSALKTKNNSSEDTPEDDADGSLSSSTPSVARACYVKGKLKGTSMEDRIKHKVYFVKNMDELLQLDHIYCQSCALEYCWGADLDNRILLRTKSHEQEEREKREEMEQDLKLQQKKGKGRRHSATTTHNGKSKGNSKNK